MASRCASVVVVVAVVVAVAIARCGDRMTRVVVVRLKVARHRATVVAVVSATNNVPWRSSADHVP
jgi:hypothetical protein